MIKTTVAFVEGRLLSSQSEQFKKHSKSSDWLKKAGPLKKPLLFWSYKQAICDRNILVGLLTGAYQKLVYAYNW